MPAGTPFLDKDYGKFAFSGDPGFAEANKAKPKKVVKPKHKLVIKGSSYVLEENKDRQQLMEVWVRRNHVPSIIYIYIFLFSKFAILQFSGMIRRGIKGQGDNGGGGHMGGDYIYIYIYTYGFKKFRSHQPLRFLSATYRRTGGCRGG